MKEKGMPVLFSPSLLPLTFQERKERRWGGHSPYLPLSLLSFEWQGRKQGKVGGSLLKGMREKGRPVLLPPSLLPFPFKEWKQRGGVGLPLTSLPPSHYFNEK